MKEQEDWYTHEERKLLSKERYSTSSHHYFFELKEAKNGSKYIIISQRKKVGTEFVGAKIRLFVDEMLEFQRILHHMISQAFYEHGAGITSMDSSSYDGTSVPLEKKTPVPVPAPSSLLHTVTSHFRRFWKSESSPVPQTLSDLRPGFFQHLLTTTNWQNFEEYTYYLLKLLGIQTVYHFLGERQAGRADGFFKQGNLAVLYDCTLRTEQIEYTKNDQLANYCHQLQHGSLDITQETQENFPHHHKQVWIISRGTTRRIKLINGLEIKEIAIADLMCLYDERLRQKLPEHILESVLRNLGTE